jgi:hypothetical protein
MKVLVLLGESSVPQAVRLVKEDAKAEAIAWVKEIKAEEAADWAANYPDEEPLEEFEVNVGVDDDGDFVSLDDMIIMIMEPEEVK